MTSTLTPIIEPRAVYASPMGLLGPSHTIYHKAQAQAVPHVRF